MNRFPAFSREILVVLLLTCITVTTYWPVQNYLFVNVDDSDYVYDNPHVTTGLTAKNIVWAFTHFHSANWHPITWISHMVDVELYGLNAGGHHLTNLYFHIANVLLLFFLLRRMTGACWRSTVVAALFAVHPLHVESVAWVAERKDVLSTFFLLLTLYAYQTYASRRSHRGYLKVVFFFILGLMAKPMIVTLPLLLLLLDFWPLRRISHNIKDGQCPLFSKVRQSLVAAVPLVLEKVPLLLLSFFSSLITIYAQKNAFMSIPFLPRISNVVVSYTHYLGAMLFPVRLSVYYPFPDALVWWKTALAALMLFIITAAALRQRNKQPWFITGWLWYLCTLVPVIGIVQVGGQARADRYTYIPLIGIFIIVAWGAWTIFKNMHYSKTILCLGAVLCIGSAALIARVQISYWQNSITLFRHAINVTKTNCMAQVNLSSAFYNMEDNYDSAMYH